MLEEITNNNSKIKNNADEENELFHMKLILQEKERELNKFKKNCFVKFNLPDDAMDSTDSIQVKSTNNNGESNTINCSTMHDQKLVNDVDEEVDEVEQEEEEEEEEEEGSLATTNSSQIRKNHVFFKDIILPYVYNLITCLQSSIIFKDDAINLNNSFKEMMLTMDNDDLRLKFLLKILDNLSFIVRQQTSLLNKELTNKKISKKLDNIFVNFYNNKPNDLNQLKFEILNLFNNIPSTNNTTNFTNDMEFIPIGFENPNNLKKTPQRNTHLRNFDINPILQARDLNSLYNLDR